jgi:hypothetical protein
MKLNQLKMLIEKYDLQKNLKGFHEAKQIAALKAFKMR